MPVHTHPQYRDAVIFLRTIGNERRYALVPMFRQYGPMTCTVVAMRLGIHVNAASKHLQKMVRVGILKSRRRGGSVLFDLAPDFQKKLSAATFVLRRG